MIKMPAYLDCPRLTALWILLLLAVVGWHLPPAAHAMNPLLPPTAFIPDGEPRVFIYKGEQRVFLYGSRDERVTAYCGFGHDVWSAPVNDLTRWTSHGEVFHVNQVKAIGYGIKSSQHFGAPDCVYNPITKKFHLYTFLGTPFLMDGKEGPAPGSPGFVPGFEQWGPKCVMAVSDSPAGPFINPVMCDWAPGNKDGTFDPAVLVDEQEDGSIRVYAYWGMRKGDRWAELDPSDMHTIIDPKTRQPNRDAWHSTLGRNPEVSLFEASSIRKVAKDKYVFICSANERRSALSYFYGPTPAGPWTFGGRIVDNVLGWKGGNNHGSIAQIAGQWFVFYHRSTSDDYNRQAMAEPITLRIEGDRVVIPPVEMTSQGVSRDGLPAFQRYNAGIASYRTNNAFIDGKARAPDGLNPIVGIDTPGTVLGYKYLNFGTQALTDADSLRINLSIQVLRPTVVTVSLASPSAEPNSINDPANWISIAQLELKPAAPADNPYCEVSALVSGLDAPSGALRKMGGLKGKRALFLTFAGDGGELCRLKEFELSKGRPIASTE